MSWRVRTALISLLLLAALWFNNTSAFIALDKEYSRSFLAHRGVHQIYAGTDRSSNACQSSPIAIAGHSYVENTIESMRAAFDYGAEVVELDVHLTTDKLFAVFHDWRLECKTDGAGVTEEHSFDYLRSLDIAYNYSVDGVSFPLRGTGVAKIPTLTDVFLAFPKKKFLINFKSKNVDEGIQLVTLLERGDFYQQVFGVYGGAIPTQAAIAKSQVVMSQMVITRGLRGFDRSSLKNCLKRYALLGWTGYVPAICSNTIVAIPIDFAKYLWGWPHKFTQRMKLANTEVILWGPYDGSGYSSGFDSIEAMSLIPDGFMGYVWTDKIEVVGVAD